METTPESILLLAIEVARTNARWTTREVDGLFYFKFCHQGLRNHLKEIRRRAFPSTEPSTKLSLDKLVSLDEVQLPFEQGSDAYLEIHQLAERFAVPTKYVAAALLGDSAIPFHNFALKMHFEEFPPRRLIFRLDIYSENLTSSDWASIRRSYAVWNATVNNQPVHRPDQALDIRVRFVTDETPHLEVMAEPPYGSPHMFEAFAEEQLVKFQSSFLPVTGGPRVAIRAWTVFLLSGKCGMSQRDAIRRANDSVGELCGEYRIDEDLTGMGDAPLTIYSRPWCASR